MSNAISQEAAKRDKETIICIIQITKFHNLDMLKVPRHYTECFEYLLIIKYVKQLQ